MFDPYCKLYIQTDVERSSVLSRCHEVLGGSQSRNAVENSLLLLRIDENDDFDEERLNSEQNYVFAKFVSEVEGIEDDVSEESFIESICKLITTLRTDGMLVVAACEFGDEVAARTGSN